MENGDLLKIVVALSTILYYNSLRERHYLKRYAILHPIMSPAQFWRRHAFSGDDWFQQGHSSV